MRTQIKTLSISLAALLILGCSAAFADTKKPKPKPDEYPNESIKFNYQTLQPGSGPNVRKPITTTVNPALQGAGPGLTAGRPTIKFSPEYTRH